MISQCLTVSQKDTQKLQEEGKAEFLTISSGTRICFHEYFLAITVIYYCYYVSIIAEERAGAGPERAGGPDDKVPAEDRQRQGAGTHEDGQPGLRQAQGGHAGPQPHPGPGEGDQGIYRDQISAFPFSRVRKIVLYISRI